MNLSDVAILNAKSSDYGCMISLISKNDATNLMQNDDLTKKCKTLSIKILENFKVYIRMEKTITKFGDIEIEKQKFHEYKKPISIKNIDVNKIVVSNKVFLV